MQLSERVQSMQFSPIRRFNVYADEAAEQGAKVYKLNIGQPDIKTPECFMESIRNYDSSVIAYAQSQGTSELQDAVIAYFSMYDMNYGRDNIIITTGGSEALNMIFTAILNAGDEVLMPEPFYTNYHTFITSAGGKVVPVTTVAEEGYHYADREKIEKRITDKTKAIVCVNPGNPTGTILTEEEIKLILDIAKENDLWVIADEVYREFAYDGRKITSFGMFEEYADRVVIVDSVSKRFSACGARIGCAVTKNKKLYSGLMKLAQGRLCASTVDQVGAAALYRLDRSYYDEVRSEYESRRDAVYEEIMKIPGAVCRKPGGAFYMTVKLPVEDIEDFLMFLLKEYRDNNETVMFAPAQGFYGTEGLGKDELRIAYVLKCEDMVRGAQLIAGGLEAYKNR